MQRALWYSRAMHVRVCLFGSLLISYLVPTSLEGYLSELEDHLHYYLETGAAFLVADSVVLCRSCLETKRFVIGSQRY